MLIVAGTDDTFVGSQQEAPRLKALLEAHGRIDSSFSETTRIHWVEGAGHGGTLDDRCDLAVVMVGERCPTSLNQSSPHLLPPESLPTLGKSIIQPTSPRPTV